MLLWKKSGAKVDRLARQLNITRLSLGFSQVRLPTLVSRLFAVVLACKVGSSFIKQLLLCKSWKNITHELLMSKL